MAWAWASRSKARRVGSSGSAWPLSMLWMIHRTVSMDTRLRWSKLGRPFSSRQRFAEDNGVFARVEDQVPGFVVQQDPLQVERSVLHTRSSLRVLA